MKTFPNKKINSTLAALIYALAAYYIVSPLDGYEIAAAIIGSIATYVMFWNYMRLAEKVANGQVIMIGGKFYPVDA